MTDYGFRQWWLYSLLRVGQLVERGCDVVLVDTSLGRPGGRDSGPAYRRPIPSNKKMTK